MYFLLSFVLTECVFLNRGDVYLHTSLYTWASCNKLTRMLNLFSYRTNDSVPCKLTNTVTELINTITHNGTDL